MTENSDTSDKPLRREITEKKDSSKEVSGETANESQIENEAKQYQQCRLQVRVDKKGNVEVVSMDKDCLRIFEELPPVRKQFWKHRLAPELRRKTEQAEESKDADEAQESKDGRQTA